IAYLDIEITGHRGGQVSWIYEWKQVVLDERGQFVEPELAEGEEPVRTGVGDYYFAYNTIETNNQAASEELGSGDRLNAAPPNVILKLQPIGIGAVICGARLVTR